jgi:hypothetical protein
MDGREEFPFVGRPHVTHVNNSGQLLMGFEALSCGITLFMCPSVLELTLPHSSLIITH